MNPAGAGALHAATAPAAGGAGRDRVVRLRADLTGQWAEQIIGPMAGWPKIEGQTRIRLVGLPEPFATELAWMAYWQHVIDGTPVGLQPINQLANIIRRAMREHHPLPGSIAEMDAETALRLLRWFYLSRWGRTPAAQCQQRMRALIEVAGLAMIVRCHDRPWWELDMWHPRCDARIPLGDREPRGDGRINPGRISIGWLRDAAKWQLGTTLQAGQLRWCSISQRLPIRFDRWLAEAFTDPRQVLTDPAAAPAHAAAFRLWTAQPDNRVDPGRLARRRPARVHPRRVNDDVRTVAELFEFVADHAAEARAVLGATSPWTQITSGHAAAWFRSLQRLPHHPALTAWHYVDDHALAQIITALPLLGTPRTERLTITRADGTQVDANGFGDPQAMRMILLQILTGRRSSEIRICEFDCLTPVDNPADQSPGDAGRTEPVFRFRYAQSKIDIAPDVILVDSEVAAIIREQQRWVHDQFPTLPERYLFVARKSNRHAAKPYSAGTYQRWLREVSHIVQITDSAGRMVSLSHTHRFRHTRLTRLAELGLPIKVLQRYAGHATPTMAMHYIAARDEHAEQAFLATTKLRADGTRIELSRDDHDTMHLFDRADRILANGWCLLPPLKRCEKGNACLTCSLFATDRTHQDTLQRQLAHTDTLIETTTATFARRHGRTMPEDNVWLQQRRAEQHALARLLRAFADQSPDSGCRTTTAGPMPITLEPPARKAAR